MSVFILSGQEYDHILSGADLLIRQFPFQKIFPVIAEIIILKLYLTVRLIEQFDPVAPVPVIVDKAHRILEHHLVYMYRG